MQDEQAFKRGLSPQFIIDLRTGMLAPLLNAASQQDTDLQIREDSINLYYQGLSALKLTRDEQGSYTAEIHLKFLTGIELPGEKNRGKKYVKFEVTAAFVEAYVQQLAALKANADLQRLPEPDAEQTFVRNSQRPDSTMTILDRQVRVHGILKQADLIGLTHEDDPRLIIGEIKVGMNNDIQLLHDQLESFFNVMTGIDGLLRPEVADAYRTVVAQKQELGVLPRSVVFPKENPRVECLALLCNYNSRSKLLERARDQARDCGFEIWVVQPRGPDYRVPDVARWMPLCP